MRLQAVKRNFLAGFLEKVSLVVFTILVVEPIVVRHINKLIIIGGLIAILLFMSYAVWLKTQAQSIKSMDEQLLVFFGMVIVATLLIGVAFLTSKKDKPKHQPLNR